MNALYSFANWQIKLFRIDCLKVILINYWKVQKRIDLIAKDLLTVQVND